MHDIPSASIVRLGLQALESYCGQFADTMIVMLDEANQIVYVNARFLKETGYAESDLLHQPIGTITDGAAQWMDPAVLYKTIAERLQNPLNEGIPLQLTAAEGYRMSATAAPIIVETERDIRCLLFVSSQSSMRSGNLIERFGETMLRDEHIGVILLHPETLRIFDISPLACQLLGVEQSAVVNVELSSFFEESEKEYAIISEALASGETVRNYPLTWRYEDKQSELLMDVGLLHSTFFAKEGAYIIFKDVTNLRSLETQVQRSDRLAMIGQIAAGAAHEIRNPLTAIRGFLQMFRKTMIEHNMNKEKEYTEIMLGELDRINHLVGEFLLLSKPKQMTASWIGIDSVLRDIMPVIASEALLHNVTVNWDDQMELPRVLADAEMLKQVFLNLCKNGIEAMTEGGTLTVRGYVLQTGKSSRIIIEIEDTGPGIPPQLIHKIFDPFVTTKQNGTGLGLSVCQRILHDFSGTITAATRDRGALFKVMLPC
ncbi:nitrogen-specific signal transduction histidine kinase [Paenibacillus taihuensis]|uniref:histidine kinase n=1 Tax=Paenibacillus taihuensis TaxID=1156355 RepID=A0A3D9Q963_9BACL|nr:ATP-binding protein [Paenibacillus taihuensis]REE57394.1 nitrogen-specific signal transduction histidine kinase [Paenibacillus taihuensis]